MTTIPKQHEYKIKGAFNIKEQIIINPLKATKEDAKNNNLICLECEAPLILKKGDINEHHYCHYSGSDCNLYDKKLTKEQVKHKDAILMIQTLFNHIKCNFIFETFCRKDHKHKCGSIKRDVYNYSQLHTFYIEHPLQYNNYTYQADIAIVDEKGDIVIIIEICDTHSTNENNRPEPWVELDAETVIKEGHEFMKLRNENFMKYENFIKLECIRKYICPSCKIKEEAEFIIKEKIAQKEAIEYALNIFLLKKHEIIIAEEKRIKREKLEKQKEEELIIARLKEIEEDFDYNESSIDDEAINRLLQKYNMFGKSNITKKYPAGKKRCATCYRTIDIKWKKCFPCNSDIISCVIVDDEDE